MAYWTTIENPSPELLKSLFDAATSKKGPCRTVEPGVRTAYQEKLVCHGPDGVPIFDLNEVAARNAARREEP